jgi:hypothetical protein
MAHDLDKLQGQVPDTVIMGQTADISFFNFEFPCYSWVVYNELRGQFSDDAVVLYLYLGPTEPEVGSVLTAKLLKSNGKVIWRNTVCHL